MLSAAKYSAALERVRRGVLALMRRAPSRSPVGSRSVPVGNSASRYAAQVFVPAPAEVEQKHRVVGRGVCVACKHTATLITSDIGWVCRPCHPELGDSE